MVAGLIGIAMIAELAAISGTRILPEYTVPADYVAQQHAAHGAVGMVAKPLFNEYLLAFELTSILLLVAVAGAVVLGKRRDRDAR